MPLVSDPTPSGEMPDVTARAPVSRVSGGQIARSYEELGQGEQELSQGLEKGVATPLAERQAAEDVQNQKVMLGPDGKIQVQNQARSLIWGRAGDAYADVVRQGTVSQVGTVVDNALTDIHQKHLADPQGQATANESFIEGLKGATGNPVIDNAIVNRARERAGAHLDSNIDYAARINLANSETSLKAQRTDVEQQLETLAQNGVGPGDKNYDALMSQRAAIQAQFAASPILREPPETVALMDKNLATRLQGYHLVHDLDDIVKKQNIFKAQDALDEFVRQHPELDRQDAARIKADGMSHLEKYRPQAEADIRSSQEDTRGILKSFAAGVDKGPRAGQFRDSALAALENARKVGDFWGASQLEGALNFAGISFPALKDDGSGSTIQSNAPHSTSPNAAAPGAGYYAQSGLTKDRQPLPPPTAAAPAAAPAEKEVAPGLTPHAATAPDGTALARLPLDRREDRSRRLAGRGGQGRRRAEVEPAVATAAEAPKAAPAALTTGAAPGGSITTPEGLAAYKARVAQIETGGNPNQTSPSGATGKYQFTRGTWAVHGGGGDIHGDQEAAMDHLTAANHEALASGLGREPTPAEMYLAHQQGAQGFLRMIAEPGRRAGDIVGDAAIRGNGGDPNAPAIDFIRMWEAKYDRTAVPAGDGATGGTSANGHPQFSPEQLRANPYLNSALIRSFAEDPEDRYSSISAKAEMTENLAKVGIASPTEEVGAILQYAQSRPDDERAQNLAAKVMGTQLALAATSGGPGGGPGGGGPQARETVEKEIHDWANGPDILHKQAAAVAMEKEIEFDKFAKEHPYLHAANAGILKGPAPMIDPGNPQTIPGAIAARAGMGDFIGKMRGTQTPSLLGESGDGDAFKASLAGPSGADVIRGIGQLKPEVLSSLTSEPAFREGLTAMSHSTDPAKLNAAYGLMDTLARQNPLDFDAKFKDGVKDLTRWQKELSMLPPDQIAKTMQQYNDPNERQAFDKAGKIADKNLESVSADSVVSKFSTGGFWSLGTTAQAPQGEPGRVDAKMAMKADYDEAYRDAFAESSNASTADATAMRKISAKWGMSETNGNRVMPYPPEQAYRNKDGSPMMVNGSFAWMKKQLDDDVLKAVGDTGGAKPGEARAIWEAPLTEAQNEALVKASAPRALVSDATTAADVASGKPASYKVVIQDKDGRFSVLSDAASGKDLRVRFDQAQAQATQIEGAETSRAAAQQAAATIDTEGHGTGPDLNANLR